MTGLCGRLVALVIALGLLLVSPMGANAQSFDNALAGFTSDSFNDTDAASAAVAASGNSRALAIIQALQESRLLFTPDPKKVYIREPGGAIIDAATGQIVTTAPADLKPVRLNNRVRRTIDAAVGSMTLLAPERTTRLEAARAVFKSKDASALPTLEAAIAKEADPAIRRAMLDARAAVVLFMPETKESDKAEAVAVMRERGDQD